jgi:hypothetical protein
MGIQPGARFPARSADALPATLYGHFTQTIYRNWPIKWNLSRQYDHDYFTYHDTTQYGQVTLRTGQQSMYQWWNYLRRQLFVMDTYATPHNRLINHGMLAALSYLSLAVGPGGTCSVFCPSSLSSIPEFSLLCSDYV